MTDLLVGGRRITLDPRALLGIGGEASVYRSDELALKVFHGATQIGGSGGRSAGIAAIEARELALKERKITAFPNGLPHSVVAPIDALRTLDGRFVGYSMRRIDDARPLGELLSGRGRERALLCRVLAGLAESLEALHRRDVRVGDLNDYNVLASPSDLAHYLIDVDSYQFAGLPCTVAHERFLAPELYGVDLGRAPRFEPEHDWYAFAVLLFIAVFGVHPFGGVHPKLNTLLKRATARASIFDPAVRIPRGVPRFEILGDRALDWLRRIFEDGTRERPPREALRLEWSVCSRCGTEHARMRCPNCLGPTALVHASDATQPRQYAADSSRDGWATTAATFSDGRIVAAQWSRSLRYLIVRGERLYDESAHLWLEGFDPARTEVRLAGDKLALLRRDQLLILDREGLRGRHRVASFEGQPQIGAAGGAFYFVSDDSLDCDQEPYRVAPVLGGQTWFAVGERLGIVYYQTATLAFFFTFEPGRPGLRPLTLPARPGRQRLAAHFDGGDSALLEILRTEAGREWLELYYIRGGVVRASRRVPRLGDHGIPPLQSKILRGDHVVCASDEGIVTLRVDGDRGTIERETIISGSDVHVDAATTLLTAPGGAIGAVHSTRIVRLDLA
ncbi:MAG: hypothetical protein KC609_11670 [Myxococcales bacterium]|nr:hypothetical protein [Myxococcales bacterium]